MPSSVPIDVMLRTLNESRSATVPELAEALVAEFKGVKGLARAVREVFEAPDTSAQTKSRLLSDVMGMIRVSNEMEPQETPADLIAGESDDELKDTLASVLGNLGG